MNWQIFCRVVDNFGDIGVCWRLAKQLRQEHDQTVTLWVDDLPSFTRLCPQAQPSVATQTVQGILIRHWDDAADRQREWPECAVTIEAFGCGLPDSWLAAMRDQPSLWINLEYLSAEDWVPGFHLGESPLNGLRRRFFFPGFVAGTGGLLYDRGLDGLRQQAAQHQAKAAYATGWGLPAPEDALFISLFCYENPALPALLEQLSQQPQPTWLWVPQGRISRAVTDWLEVSLPEEDAAQPRCFSRNALTVVQLPFMPQPDYDRLLAVCDLNCVRGEDSFVRAQILAKPTLWHIYPQQQQAHWDKLDAWLSLYLKGCTPHLYNSITYAHKVWNQTDLQATIDWSALLQQLPEWREHAGHWQQQLTVPGELASNLVSFAENSIYSAHPGAR